MLVFLPLLLSLTVSAIGSPTEKRAKAKLITKCTVSNTVALTFDDGPYIYLNDVVDTVKKANAKGTFFFNGNNYGCIYDDAMVQRVKYAYDNGFQVASHTWAHKDLTKLTSDQIDSEMSRTEEAIRKITGATPAYTRPPYGNVNDLVYSVAGSRGQTLVTWDFDSGDSTGSTVNQQKQAYDELVSKHPNTILSLEHEVYGSPLFYALKCDRSLTRTRSSVLQETTAHEVLPYVISKLQGAGYKLVTLSECLNTSPYLKTGAPSTRDATWKC
ncbi:hypothetical protein CVT25_013195 [Psilocybe cyanescens]|uniref:NodB homology domain-containing protein n=1 Tax=Psilocybe cyanescens TaxID=93625 RepID=A0A409XLQ6_PSICY|nr:hypothetical protein CVT25_013195 [Psilocybe cyanescens]